MLIPLTRGYHTLVDDVWYPWLSQIKWQASIKNRKVYAVRRDRKFGKLLYLHRLVADPALGQIVDHINNDTLDNRLTNLRSGSVAENVFNRSHSNSVSGYCGVTWCSRTARWRAKPTIRGTKIHIGRYDTPELAYEAIMAYLEKHEPTLFMLRSSK